MESPDREDVERPTADAPGRCVLYPVVDGTTAGALHLAASIAAGTDATLVVGHLDTGDEFSLAASREAAHTALAARNGLGVDVALQSHTLQGPTPQEAVLTAVETYDPGLVLVGRETAEALEHAPSTMLDADTVVVNEVRDLESVASILLPYAGGTHADRQLAIAAAIARPNDAWLELLHVTDPDPSAETTDAAEALLAAARNALPDDVEVDAQVVAAEDVVDRIVEASTYHDVTVVGAPTTGRLKRFVFGSTATDIDADARNTVAMVREN